MPHSDVAAKRAIVTMFVDKYHQIVGDRDENELLDNAWHHITNIDAAERTDPPVCVCCRAAVQ
jgi:hypothetical protein